MLILIVFLLILISIETYYIIYLYKKEIKPIRELWFSIKDIDFTSDKIDFSKIDNIQVTKAQSITDNIILKFKYLVDIICERISMVNEVTDVSEHDGLTGCYNVQRLNTYKYSYQQMPIYLIIFIDVNNLKRMNDTLGHEAGDRLIKEATKHINFWKKYSGDVYRIGGDEFMVVLPNVSYQQACQTINTWHNGVGVIAETPEGFKCMLSIGIAEGHKGEYFDLVQKTADDRMYNFKVNLKKQLGEPLR